MEELQSTSFTISLDIDGQVWYTDTIGNTEELTLITEDLDEARAIRDR